MKKLISMMATMAFMFGLVPVAFAGNAEEAIEPIDDTGAVVEDIMPYPTYINVNVSTTTYALPSKIVVTANYSSSTKNSRKAVLEELNAVYEDVQGYLGEYGKLNRTGMSVYPSYSYDGTNTSSYSGYLDVRLELDNVSYLETAKNRFFELGFNPWVDAQLDDETKADLESSMADTLKSLINKKKATYEKILEVKLSNPSSLWLNTWADGTYYDEATGKVQVTITADIGYNAQSK